MSGQSSDIVSNTAAERGREAERERERWRGNRERERKTPVEREEWIEEVVNCRQSEREREDGGRRTNKS